MSINLEDIISQVKQVEDAKIQKEKGGFKGDPRLITFKKNCTYTFRLIPNIKDVNATFVTWKEVGWKSVIDGTYIYGGRSPQDAGIKEDLYKSTQWESYSKAKERGDEVAQKASYKLLAARKQAVNAYLVAVDGDDPESKEKVGTVVALKYSAQVDKAGTPLSDIYKRIYGAIFGDMAKKIGTKALDLSAKGKSLIIKVTEKAGFNNYSETMFDDSEDLGLNDKKIKELYDSVHDLNEFVPELKTTEEIRKLLDTHWHGVNASHDDELDESDIKPRERKPADDDDEIPMGTASKTTDMDLDALLADDK